MNNITNTQISSLMHTGMSSSDEEDDNTLMLNDDDNINFDDDLFNDEEDNHFSQLQENEIANSQVDYGQNNISWKQFIVNKASSSKYVARINDFLHWQLDSRVTAGANSLVDKLVLYFQASHLALKDNGSMEARYAPTTLRGWFSMFVRFWQLTGKGNLHVLCPIIELNITCWETIYNSKVAKTLTKEDCLALYSLPSTSSNLILKCFCILALHIAGRNCETTYLTWDCLHVLHNDDNEKSYRLTFERKKRRGVASTHSQYCIITGETEVLNNTLFPNLFCNA